MKIMISQPMRGKSTDRIKWERENIVKRLQDEGHCVLDTVFTENAPVGYDEGLYYLAKSIEAMSKADAVVFMPRLERSKRVQNRRTMY